MIHRIIKSGIRLFIIFFKLNWLKLFRLYSSQANSVLWIPPKGITYFIGNAILWDMATLNAFAKNDIPFRIVRGKKIGALRNKRIYHTVNRGTNVFGLFNYTSVYRHVLAELEDQGNMLIPKSAEVEFWENKNHMHREFARLGVNEPKTQLISLDDFKIDEHQDFPYLIKAEHASSAKGVYKINSNVQLQELLQDPVYRLENKVVIKQELINMRKDLRVILVGAEVILFYWRINNAKEWRPTSTSFGSDVDFVFFPEQWREHIVDTFLKLDLSTGAFDITWHNDDLATEPVYLEVSPVYEPNPKIELRGKPYASYKKKFSPFNEYDKKYVEVVFEIKMKQVQNSLKVNS